MTETPDQPPAETEAEHGEQILTAWKFRGKPPTVEQVKALLATLPRAWGVDTGDFFDYVQALPSTEKIKVAHPSKPGVMVDERIDVWTLYMSVAGRQAMLVAAQEINGWRVDYVPEPTVAPPGYLEFGARLVYRVSVEIYERMSQITETDSLNQDSDGVITFAAERLLGQRTGTAWVPGFGQGGQNAAGTNPPEKVETSALGRALGAWGFGVLPGSGIASLEEMQQISQNREFLEAVKSGQPAGAGRRTREELLQEVAATNERLREALGLDQEQADRAIGTYLTSRLHLSKAFDEKTAIIDWDQLKDGHLDLLLNALKERLRQAQSIDNPLGG
jgi:hypothetical protein